MGGILMKKFVATVMIFLVSRYIRRWAQDESTPRS